MKAKDLINQLSKLDGETDIVLFGEEMCGYHPNFKLDKVSLNRRLDNGGLRMEPTKLHPIEAFVLSHYV